MYIMPMKMRARTSGTHPPSCTLMRQEEAYIASKEPNTKKNPMARKRLLCHTTIMIKVIRHVVTNMTIVTARPGKQIKLETQDNRVPLQLVLNLLM